MGESAQVELTKLLQTLGVTLQRENARAVLRRLGDNTAAASTALADLRAARTVTQCPASAQCSRTSQYVCPSSSAVVLSTNAEGPSADELLRASAMSATKPRRLEGYLCNSRHTGRAPRRTAPHWAICSNQTFASPSYSCFWGELFRRSTSLLFRF